MNPKFKDFLEKYPNKTLIGVAWSLGWRLYLVVVGVAMVFGIGSAVVFASLATL